MLDGVLRRARGRAVRRIRVRVGVLHAVDQESMAQGCTLVAQGTEAAEAVLEVVAVPARILCGGCGYQAETRDPVVSCPHGPGRAGLTGGDDLVLESITDAPAQPGVA